MKSGPPFIEEGLPFIVSLSSRPFPSVKPAGERTTDKQRRSCASEAWIDRIHVKGLLEPWIDRIDPSGYIYQKRGKR